MISIYRLLAVDIVVKSGMCSHKQHNYLSEDKFSYAKNTFIYVAHPASANKTTLVKCSLKGAWVPTISFLPSSGFKAVKVHGFIHIKTIKTNSKDIRHENLFPEFVSFGKFPPNACWHNITPSVFWHNTLY